MAVVKVQSATGNGATIVLNGVATGNCLILQTSYFRSTSTAAAETTPTDSNGTFAVGIAATPAVWTGKDTGASIFYESNTASGTHTVTPQANSSHVQSLVEYSGLITSSPLDQATSNKSSADHTTLDTGTTGTTAQNDELVIIGHGLAAAGGSADVGYTDPVSGFTTVYRQPDDATSVAALQAYQVISAIGTQTATFNWTAHESDMASQAVIATFKAQAGGGGAGPIPVPVKRMVSVIYYPG